MLRRLWAAYMGHEQRLAVKARGMFVVTTPKRQGIHVAVQDLTVERMRSMLEDHACSISFNGTAEDLQRVLECFAQTQAGQLERYHGMTRGPRDRVVQFRIRGQRDIRRLVRLVP